jgi:hypothetical protein
MGLIDKFKSIWTSGDGGQIKWQDYSDVTEFADAAELDEGDAVKNLDFIIEASEGDDFKSLGYAKEAKDVVNQRRLGKN